MITQTFKHTHACSFEGEELTVRPNVEGGAFFRQVPVCLEKGVELELIEVTHG